VELGVGQTEACVQIWEFWDTYQMIRTSADSVKTLYQKTFSDREDFVCAVITVILEHITQYDCYNYL
jgi:hypothetical protein